MNLINTQVHYTEQKGTCTKNILSVNYYYYQSSGYYLILIVLIKNK